MSKLTDQVQNQIRVSEQVIASARTHCDAVSAALADISLEVEGPQTKATKASYQVLIASLANRLTFATSGLRESAQSLAAERADDPPVRLVRDNVTQEVTGLLSSLASMTDSHCGPEAVVKYGLRGEFPRVPAKLLESSRNVVGLLHKYPLVVTNAFGSTLDTKNAAAVLDVKNNELEAAVNDDNREIRELEKALDQRDKAAATWADAYQGTATTLEGLYRLAGFKDLAEKVRPTQRKLKGEDPGDEPPTGG